MEEHEGRRKGWKEGMEGGSKEREEEEGMKTGKKGKERK